MVQNTEHGSTGAAHLSHLTQDAPLVPPAWFSRHGIKIAIFIILVLAFFLRSYHLDYPVVGYHNWKETHYLTEARNFARDGWFAQGILVPSWDYPALFEDPSGRHSDTLPTTPLLVSLLFRVTGPNLVVARLFNILLVLGSIVLWYLIVKKLFHREDLALATAAVLAINPLLVFFGRQMDVLNSAMFFTTLGVYVYLHWIEKMTWPRTVLFAIALLIGVATKVPFALLGLPLLAVFPWQNFKDKQWFKMHISKFVVIGVLCLLFGAWFLYIRTVSSDLGEELSKVRPELLASGDFWQIMNRFISDNFTLWGVGIALLGAILFLMSSLRRWREPRFAFFAAYILGSLVWFVVLAEKMMGHNYHQYPLVPLFAFLIAYVFVLFAGAIGKGMSSLLHTTENAPLLHRKGVAPVLLVLALILLYLPSASSMNRMFNTQFPGLDVAGDYIREHKQPGDRVMHSSGQAFGVLWHGDIKGTKIQRKIEYIEKAEELGVRWFFIYQWDLNIMDNAEVWQYISENYGPAQVGFVNDKNGQSIVYILLQKGGTFDKDKINDYVKGKQIRRKPYQRTDGDLAFGYVNLA